MSRAGCPNILTKGIREQFNIVFALHGGATGLYNWTLKDESNLKAFYLMYAKMVPKELKIEDANRTHEQFIKLTQAQEEQRRIDKGTPVKMIDVSAENLDTDKLKIT